MDWKSSVSKIYQIGVVLLDFIRVVLLLHHRFSDLDEFIMKDYIPLKTFLLLLFQPKIVRFLDLSYYFKHRYCLQQPRKSDTPAGETQELIPCVALT